MTEIHEEIGKIADTHIGLEDHGMMTVSITLEGDGWRQGIGHYRIGTWSEPIEDAGWVAEFIRRFTQAAGAETWENLPGKRVKVLREGSFKGRIVGIDKVPTFDGERFLFEEVMEE